MWRTLSAQAVRAVVRDLPMRAAFGFSRQSFRRHGELKFAAARMFESRATARKAYALESVRHITA